MTIERKRKRKRRRAAANAAEAGPSQPSRCNPPQSQEEEAQPSTSTSREERSESSSSSESLSLGLSKRPRITRSPDYVQDWQHDFFYEQIRRLTLRKSGAEFGAHLRVAMSAAGANSRSFMKLQPEDKKTVLVVFSKLLRGVVGEGKYAPLEKPEFSRVCQLVVRFLRAEPIVLRVSSPIYVVGDIHGQFLDLMTIFEDCGRPFEGKKYLFLGDYVDRGHQSVEVVSLLFVLKIMWPDKVYLLRGNHEDGNLSDVMGFAHETQHRFGEVCHQDARNAFKYLSMAAVIDNHTFCAHGGISSEMTAEYLEDNFRGIVKPFEAGETKILHDILWNDIATCEDGRLFSPGTRDNEKYGDLAVYEFLQRYNLRRIIRGHQLLEGGYAMNFNSRVITVNSAQDMGGSGAKGIVCSVTYERDISRVEIITYGPHKRNYSIPSGAHLSRALRLSLQDFLG